jgi:hypothetical protein
MAEYFAYSMTIAMPPFPSTERVGVFGPPGGTREFQSMKSLAHERPYANELVGAHSTGPVTGGADWICTKPDHWIFKDTGMKKGDRIPGLVGWEYHGDPPADIPGLEVVAEGTAWQGGSRPQHWTATIHDASRRSASRLPRRTRRGSTPMRWLSMCRHNSLCPRCSGVDISRSCRNLAILSVV